MEKSGLIYTIGYGNLKFDKFLDLINKFNVDYVIDVRSKPFSRFNPDFRRENLEILLNNQKIKYVFMGNILGGIPNSSEFLDKDGHIDYIKYGKSINFQTGISRLIKAVQKKCIIALLCSESLPEKCHRSKLIGKILLHDFNISTNHILHNWEVASQLKLENQFFKKQEQCLFAEHSNDFDKSLKTYNFSG
ncbi:MAG: DUF488 domain-containing protein [Candidatus Muiribacteriota bacterium]